MQKVLLTANRLPQPDTYPRFRKEGGQDFDNAVENCKSLLTSLPCSDSYKQLLIAVLGLGCFVQTHLVAVLYKVCPEQDHAAQRRLCADEFLPGAV